MSKTIVISDKQFDWLTRRAGPNKTVAQALQAVITGVEQYEADLRKYRAWVDGSSKIALPNPPDTLPQGG